MRHGYIVAGAAALAAAVFFILHRQSPPPLPAPAVTVVAVAEKAAPIRRGGRARRGGMDLTFLVTSDTHAGYSTKIPTPSKPEGTGIEEIHRVAIDAMNGIAGTPLPSAIGGSVGAPRGVLIAGDLTEGGWVSHWDRFVAMYGLTGKDGWLHYPVYEGIGNHDLWDGKFVQAQVAKRHGGSRYSWDWDDVHIVSLGEAPNEADRAWLAEDLAKTGPDVGVVLFFHFPLDGHAAHDNWFGSGAHHDDLERVLAGYTVLGIFNGHAHTSGPYPWRGHDAYIEGSVKHAWHSFSVVHVTDTRWTVASYNYDRRAFWWWHQKPIFGAPGRRARWLSEADALVGRGEEP